MNTTPTTEERIWAAISHLSALAFGMGIALPIVGWSAQRRKSNYASLQALQALGYQSLGFTIWILSYLVVMLVIVSIRVLTSFRGEVNGGDTTGFPSSGMLLVFIALFGLFALYFLLPIIAALACAFGRDFRYPIMGKRLERYLGYESLKATDQSSWLVEDHEFRWVAAMGHFGILILFWGIFAPLTALILYHKQSLFLRFQAIQTLVYQTVTTLFYFGGSFLYTFGLFALIGSIGWFGRSENHSPLGIIGPVILAALLLFGLVIVLLIPLLHILAQWAGYRVLKGDDYHYPLVGRWVDKWILKQGNTEMEAKLS